MPCSRSSLLCTSPSAPALKKLSSLLRRTRPASRYVPPPNEMLLPSMLARDEVQNIIRRLIPELILPAAFVRFYRLGRIVICTPRAGEDKIRTSSFWHRPHSSRSVRLDRGDKYPNRQTKSPTCPPRVVSPAHKHTKSVSCRSAASLFPGAPSYHRLPCARCVGDGTIGGCLLVHDMVVEPGVRAKKADGALRISDALLVAVRWAIESDHPRTAWHPWTGSS